MALITKNLKVENKLQFTTLSTPALIHPLSSGGLTLNVLTQFTIIVTGTGSPITMNMGDATQYEVGHRFHVYNNSSESVGIVDHSLGTVLSLLTGSSTLITLQDNSTPAGVWVFSVAASAGAEATPVVCSYSGNALTGRYLEFFPGSSSDLYPFVATTNAMVVGLSIVTAASSTCEIGIFKLSDLTTPVATISLASQTENSSMPSVSVGVSEKLAVRVTSGSVDRPGVTLYLTSV